MGRGHLWGAPLVGAVLWGTLCVQDARAQDECQEFCATPPCYRDPEAPGCNPECHCDSPDYPDCDPFCRAGEICDPSCDNHCWNEEFAGDTCSDPPPPCEPDASMRPFDFIDDKDGKDDGQLMALGNADPQVSCGTLRVDKTGYYTIFDTELSESCADQRDETGYLTIANSCNGDGWAAERNADERFLIFDSDNSEPCVDDAECGAGRVCREGNNHGRCCVPDQPVFMGTFLLVAGEDNEICIHHWCPEWEVELAADRDYGFVIDGCQGPNSIHFQIAASAIACEDETTLQPCAWGCMDGQCQPDPCESLSCDGFCKDGQCLDDNPCLAVECLHGCVRGRCLQSKNSRGPDEDGDGFSVLADCDDTRADANPERMETCDNDADDDCDGLSDESRCEGGGSGSGTGAPGSGSGSGSAGARDGGVTMGSSNPSPGFGTEADAGVAGGDADDDGCGCAVPGGRARPRGMLLATLALLVLGWRRRRRAARV